MIKYTNNDKCIFLYTYKHTNPILSGRTVFKYKIIAIGRDGRNKQLRYGMSEKTNL